MATQQTQAGWQGLPVRDCDYVHVYAHTPREARLDGRGFPCGIATIVLLFLGQSLTWLDGRGFPCGIATEQNTHVPARWFPAGWQGLPVRDCD